MTLFPYTTLFRSRPAGVTPTRALDRIRVMGAAPKLASSHSGSLLRTRVGGINLAGPHRIGVRRNVAPRSRWGKCVVAGENVVDPRNWSITRFSYDAAGRLEEIVYPSGHEVHYNFATSDLYPSSVTVVGGGSTYTELIDDVSHYPGGALAGFTADAVEAVVERDYAGQTTSRTYSGTSTLFGWTISPTTGRDGSGNIVHVDISPTDAEMTLEYDGQARLESVAGSNLRGYQNCGYTYDLSGNRASETCYSKTITYHPELLDLDGDSQVDDLTNRLASVSWPRDVGLCGSAGTITREIDRDTLGRATTGYTKKFPLTTDTYALAYDAAGRVASAIGPDAVEWLYAYNYRNLRTSKTPDEGDPVLFSYDQNGRVLSERAGTGGMREYVWLQGEPVLVMQSEDGQNTLIDGIYVLGTDHLGTPMRAWDRSTAQAVWAGDVDPFGRTVEYIPDSREAPAIEINLRRPGQLEDRETGLFQNWHRYFSPDLGSFTSPDPLTLTRPGWSQPVYAYAANNPYGAVDPRGLQCVWETMIDSYTHGVDNDPFVLGSEKCVMIRPCWGNPSVTCECTCDCITKILHEKWTTVERAIDDGKCPKCDHIGATRNEQKDDDVYMVDQPENCRCKPLGNRG